MAIQLVVVELTLDEGRLNGRADGRMIEPEEVIQCGLEDEQA
jgi:hypothetical protein